MKSKLKVTKHKEQILLKIKKRILIYFSKTNQWQLFLSYLRLNLNQSKIKMKSKRKNHKKLKRNN